jgi:hypothetical protein
LLVGRRRAPGVQVTGFDEVVSMPKRRMVYCGKFYARTPYSAVGPMCAHQHVACVGAAQPDHGGGDSAMPPSSADTAAPFPRW